MFTVRMRSPWAGHRRYSWVAAHLTRQQAEERGVPLVDWVGNDRADHVAKTALAGVKPPAALVAERFRSWCGTQIDQE